MKTKHSPGEDDPIIGFCNATSESRESALFFLEAFSWDLDNAVSGFLQGQLPPVKKPPLMRFRSRSRSPSRRIYSTTSSGLRSKPQMNADETSKTLDDSREPIRVPMDAAHDDSNDISLGAKMLSTADPVNHEVEEEGPAPSCKDM